VLLLGGVFIFAPSTLDIKVERGVVVYMKTSSKAGTKKGF
jgi:hypothetical protein